MSTPPIVIDGPLFEDATTSTGPPVPLYLSKESSVSTDTDTNPQDVPTQESKNTLLAPIAGKQSFRANGVIQGNFLQTNSEFIDPFFKSSGFELNRKNAYRIYSAMLETLVLPEQGIGYRVQDNIRGETFEPTETSFGILFDSIRTEYISGEGFRGSWNLSGKVVDGVQRPDNRRDLIDERRAEMEKYIRLAPDNFSRVFLTDSGLEVKLGEVTKLTRERNVDINVSDLIHQQENKDAVNIGAISSGVKESVTLEGRITDQQTSKTLQEVAQQIELGIHGEQAIFVDALLASRSPCAISKSSSTFLSGEPNVVEYRIELDIGVEPATGEIFGPGFLEKKEEEEKDENGDGFFSFLSELF
jgi:hypothetical protein